MTNDVVSRLATRCLTGYEELIDAWLTQVMAIDPYTQGLVDPEEVREGARIGFALILRGLADGHPPAELGPHSEQMGERRAGQGVPLESLLAAARLDAKVLWHGLIAHAEPADQIELLQSAHQVWDAVELHNTGLMTGYQRAVLEMGRQREDQRRSWFARLLDNDGRNPDVVRDAGRVLGFDITATFVVAVADGAGSDSLIPSDFAVGQVGGGQTSGGRTSSGQRVGGQTSGGQPVGGRPQGGQTAGGQTLGGQTLGGQTADGQTPGGQTAGGQAQGGQTAGGQAQGGQSSGGQTAGGQALGGQSSGGQPAGGRDSGEQETGVGRTAGVGREGAASLRGAVGTLSTLGLRLHRHDAPTGDILVVQMPTRAAHPEQVVLDALAGVPCGLSPQVNGLARVPHAVRLATATARAATASGGPVRLEDSWLEVLTAQSPELAAELTSRVLGPLYTVGVAERERLLETVRVHLAGDGAIAATAAALYCHRNTIQHRFARFRDLTGRDVRAPEDAAVIALALRATTL